MYPLIFITDQLYIPTYILTISFAYTIGLIWVVQRAKFFNIDRNFVLDVSLAIMIGGLVGARLLHVFYESPEYYLKNPLDVFKIWKGGFVFYGGYIGGTGAGCLVALYRKQSVPRSLDLFAPVASLTYAIGRMACFLNGCCYGKVCDLPWAISFPSHQDGAPLRHPTQLYTVFIELCITMILLLLEKKGQQGKIKVLQQGGSLFYLWMLMHACNRIVMEYFRDDYRGPEPGLSVSTWISIALILGFGTLLLNNFRRQKSLL